MRAPQKNPAQPPTGARRARSDPPRLDYRPLGDLAPYAANARTHSPEQVAQIGASMVEFGFTNPILTDAQGGIVAGHGRVLAARALWAAGKEIPRCPRGRVPCISLGALTDAQRRAYVLADNKIALNAGWDPALLQAELLALDGAGFDLGLTGFGAEELERLMSWVPASAGLTDPDDAPPAPAVPIIRLGDTWICGRHRVRCGDATSAADVRALLGSTAPLLMVTDPPYGVSYDADWRNSAQRANGKPFGGRAVGKVTNDDRDDWREAWDLFPGDVAYIWHGALHVASLQDQLVSCGFAARALIVWAKNNFAVSRGHYHWQHESCWYAVRDRKPANWQGDRSQTTLWQIDKPVRSDTGHSTQKPVECMRRPIINNSTPGQAVYDPFLGSGTTMIAAEMEGRACYGMEIAPAYVDVAVRRWQSFTGMRAVRDGDGRAFDDLVAAE